MSTFSEHLRDCTDESLVTLMLLRPDLANPAPTTLASLAARATSRASLDRAVARLDAFMLQVLEAAVVLHEMSLGDEAPDAAPPVTVDLLATSVGAPLEEVVRATESALAQALLWTPETARLTHAVGHERTAPLHPAPGLAEVLGPFPCGLGPALPTAHGARSTAATLAMLDHLDDAPAGAREILTALTWGPPVGRVPADRSSASARAASWLVHAGLLLTQDAHSVVLPREVGLALRDGRTHQVALLTPPSPEGEVLPLETVDAESARCAEEIVRLVTLLIRTWERTPAPVLRSGGLGVRELHRLSQQLDVDDATAALVGELALAAGLVVDDGEVPPQFSPTVAVDDWLDAELATQWEVLARAWVRSDRTAWSGGTRSGRGSQPSALDPELHRPWALRLRRVVLEVLADVPADAAGTGPVQHAGPATRTAPAKDAGPVRRSALARDTSVTALDAAAIVETITWSTPRAVPPADAVAGILREAAAIGVLGAGALGSAGRALLAELGSDHDLVEPAPLSATSPDPATALAALLAPPVDDLLLQGDLTGVVPGRPTPALAHLLDSTSEVESRGSALTVRFTADTVRRALDDGADADAVLADLAAHSRTPVPQALDYLVRDVARRHGRLRVGLAGSYVRAEDPSLLAGLVEDPAFARLGLVRLAPTVLAAQAPTATVLEALRLRGLSPSAEGPDGQVVLGRPTVRRVRGERSRAADASGPATDVVLESAAERVARLATLVPRLRGADRAAAADRTLRSREAAADDAAATARHADAPDTGTRDPAVALVTLREAVAGKRDVWIEIVGPAGTPTRRRVRPVRVEGGRVRAIDVERESELTVAVHRIGTVTMVDDESEATSG